MLSPLHHDLFSLLKTIITDGTFNQTAPLDRLVSLSKEGKLDGQTFYSFDLSAATDRLPISLQGQVLSILYGEEFAQE